MLGLKDFFSKEYCSRSIPISLLATAVLLQGLVVWLFGLSSGYMEKVDSTMIPIILVITLFSPMISINSYLYMKNNGFNKIMITRLSIAFLAITALLTALNLTFYLIFFIIFFFLVLDKCMRNIEKTDICLIRRYKEIAIICILTLLTLLNLFRDVIAIIHIFQ